MSATDLILLAIALPLVVVGGVLACADTALSRVSEARAGQLLESGRRGAKSLLRIATDPPRYLNVVVLLRVSCEILAAVLAAGVCLNLVSSRPLAYAVAAASMVIISFIVMGVAPRTIGLQHTDAAGLLLAPLIVGITRVLGPLPQLLILLGNALTPGRGLREGPFSSEAELREFVDRAGASAVIEDRERAMIHSVFELGDTIAREVMVPRTDMVFIEGDKTLGQALSLALRSGFSRIPVIGESEDDVIGIVYAKDLALRAHEHPHTVTHELVDSVLRPAAFIPESKPVDALLREMQAQRSHIAIVVDEYGGTAGLVTIEDIVEEIVGDITDEYDQVAAPSLTTVDEHTIRVSTRLSVADLEEHYKVELAEDDVDTVGGLLTKHLGKVPIPGSSVVIDGLTFTAEIAAGRRNRIGTVLVAPVLPPLEHPGADTEAEADTYATPLSTHSTSASEPPATTREGNLD